MITKFVIFSLLLFCALSLLCRGDCGCNLGFVPCPSCVEVIVVWLCAHPSCVKVIVIIVWLCVLSLLCRGDYFWLCAHPTCVEVIEFWFCALPLE